MKDELKLFSALSDETRLRIVVLLLHRKLCVGQIEWALGLPQAKISQHLSVLKNAGLVSAKRKGLWIFYSLNKPKNDLERIIYRYLKGWLTKRYDLFKKDIDAMKKFVAQPMGKLTTKKG